MSNLAVPSCAYHFQCTALFTYALHYFFIYRSASPGQMVYGSTPTQYFDAIKSCLFRSSRVQLCDSPNVFIKVFPYFKLRGLALDVGRFYVLLTASLA